MHSLVISRYLLRFWMFLALGSGVTNSHGEEVPIHDYATGDDDATVCADIELVPENRPAFCVGLEIYGAYQYLWAEDEGEGRNQSRTDYVVYPMLRLALPETAGWAAEASVEWEANDKGTDITEAYIRLGYENLSLFAGRLEVGGIDQGNEFMTELGEDITGDYGNREGEQTYWGFGYAPTEELSLAAAYSVTEGDISFEEEDNFGDISGLNLVVELELDALVMAMEAEHRDYRDNGQNRNEDGEKNRTWKSETAYGFSLAYYFQDWLMPFFNAGYLRENHEEDYGKQIDIKEFNLGVDLQLTDELGITLGVEKLADNGRLEDGRQSEDIHNLYAGFRYQLGNLHLGLAGWFSDQKLRDDNDNLARQADLEIGLVF